MVSSLAGLDFFDTASYKELKIMPLIHLAKKDRETGENSGVLILQDGFFSPRKCYYFSNLTGSTENLLYFFYAKPAYKDPQGYEPSDPPIVFVMAPENAPIRVFPFDTGAFFGKRYAYALGDNYKDEYDLMEFQMPTEMRKISKYINALWKNNVSYYRDKPHISKTITQIGNSYVKALIRLIKAPVSHKCDERKHTVEVQFDNDIQLKGSLKAIIIAQRILDKNPVIMDKISSLKATLIYYRDNGGYSLSEFFYKEIDQYYRKNGYFR